MHLSYLAIQGQYLVLFQPEFPQAPHWRQSEAAEAEGLAAGGAFVSILSSLRAHLQGGYSGLMAAASFVYWYTGNIIHSWQHD